MKKIKFNSLKDFYDGIEPGDIIIWQPHEDEFRKVILLNKDNLLKLKVFQFDAYIEPKMKMDFHEYCDISFMATSVYKT